MNYKKKNYFIVECVYYKKVCIKICRECWTKKESGSLLGSEDRTSAISIFVVGCCAN